MAENKGIVVSELGVSVQTVKATDGSYKTTLTAELGYHPDEIVGALVVGRKLFTAFVEHFKECKTIGEAFAKVMMDAKPITSTHTQDAGTPAEAKPTSPTTVEGVDYELENPDDVTGGTQVTGKGDSDVELQVNGDGNVEVVAKVDDTQQQQ